MNPNLIAVSVGVGSPELGLWAFYAVFVCWLFLQRLAAMQTDELEKLVAESVVAAMHLAGLSAKQLAGVMQIDEAQLRRQLRAEPHQHLSLSRLVRAWQLWPYLGPSILYIVAQRRWAEVLELVNRKSV